jgi:AcrR family transcriptional regulator
MALAAPARVDAGGASRGLDRQLIVSGALRFIDEEDAQRLTMRALAQQLGVAPMAMYRYVTGREDLLEAVVQLLLEGVRQDLHDDSVNSGWQRYLQTLAHAVRRVAVDHPGAFPLVATRHPAAPWLRPPLRSLDLVEQFLETLKQHGFNDKQAVGAYRAFSSFLLGQLLLEPATRGAETSPMHVPLDEGNAQVPNQDGELDLSSRPIVMRLRPMLTEDHSEDEFEVSLETLLDRLEMSISHQRARAASAAKSSRAAIFTPASGTERATRAHSVRSVSKPSHAENSR